MPPCIVDFVLYRCEVETVMTMAVFRLFLGLGMRIKKLYSSNCRNFVDFLKGIIWNLSRVFARARECPFVISCIVCGIFFLKKTFNVCEYNCLNFFLKKVNIVYLFRTNVQHSKIVNFKKM